MNPLIISRSKKPRWMKNLRDELKNIDYAASKKAWMTSQIFEDWLKKINKFFISQERKILLLMDNGPCHLIKQKFSNIEMLLLPKNSTPLTQPLDQGIIRSFKNFYRKNFLINLAFNEDNAEKTFENITREFKISDAIPIIINSWRSVTSVCIRNCFEKAFSSFKDKLKEETIQSNVTSKNIDSIEDIESGWEHEPINYKSSEVNENIDLSDFSIESEKEDFIIGDENAKHLLNKLEKYFCIDNEKCHDLVLEIKKEMTLKKKKKNILDYLIKK